ncbi:MAG TPA: thiamine pyrophosphate-dependent enzyme [Chloroflexota bacterium]
MKAVAQPVPRAAQPRTGGEALVDELLVHDVEVVFGIPSVHNLPIYEALRTRPRPRHIVCRHEQGAGLMAMGYARVTGRPGVFITSTGPGCLNSATAMGEAYGDSVPILNVTTERETFLVDRQRGAVHETKDQLGILQRLTIWATRCRAVTEVPGAIAEAMRQMATGRPRPTAVEVCTDVLGSTAETGLVEPLPVERPAGDAGLLREAAAVLAKAERPLIWVGGGAIHAEAMEEVRRLAELLQAPTVTTSTGKGALPDDHPLCLGNLVLHRPVKALLASSDVVLAVGARFSQRGSGEWALPLPKQLIHIDIDPTVIGANFPTAIGIVADARLALRQLLQELDGAVTPRPSRAGEVAAARAEVARALAERAPTEMAYLAAVREALPRSGIVACDPTKWALWGREHFPVFEPRTWLYPMGFGSLGTGLPWGIGAKVGRPDQPVVVVAGDGGFLFTATDLATAVQHGIDLAIVLFNDRRYGVIEDLQHARYGKGHEFAVELGNPDFARFAESFGARGLRASTPEALRETLSAAIKAGGVTLIEVPVALQRPFAV